MEGAAGFQGRYGSSHLALGKPDLSQAKTTGWFFGAAGGVGLTSGIRDRQVDDERAVIACARGAKGAVARQAGADEGAGIATTRTWKAK